MSESTNGTEYHWIATIQFANGTVATYDDVFTPAAPMTRFEIFHGVCDALKNKHQVAQIVILHWDLAPNHMVGGAK